MTEDQDTAAEEPAGEDQDDVLRKEQEGKGYGSAYGDDEGEAAPGLSEE